MNAAKLAPLAVAAVVYAAPAKADPRIDMGGELRSYYRGERNSAFVIGAVGLAGIGGGSALAAQPTDFARGMGWSFIGLGAIQLVGAVVYVFQVNGQIDRYESLLSHDASEYRRLESDHITTTTSRFVGYRLGELGLALTGVGIATYGFAANRDAWKGAGIGVAAISLPLIVVDAINMARAVRYRDRIESFRPTVAVMPGVGARPWEISVGGRF